MGAWTGLIWVMIGTDGELFFEDVIKPRVSIK